MSIDPVASRRRILQFLAASPLFAQPLLSFPSDAETIAVPTRLSDPIPWAPLGANGLIKDPKDALDVFDFELVAHERVPPAHFGWMASGADNEVTMRANRSDFGKFALLSRRLRNVSTVDSSIQLFGAKWDSPIFICPTGHNKAIHPEGELAVSRAAEAGRHLQMLSTYSSVSIEEAIKSRGGTPIWFQLYPTSSAEIAKALIVRAERAGSPVLVITVDDVWPRKNATAIRMRRMDQRVCTNCHETAAGGKRGEEMPNLSATDPALFKGVNLHSAGNPDWDLVRRLRDTTKMKVFIKGILAPADAALCVKYGFDGVVVSNHGGRNDDNGVSTIGILPEIVKIVRGKIPILVDSGFRRGIDIVKALAMGATAVGIGRPYLWGLGAFGQPGVEKVLEILRTETRLAMAQSGAPAIRDLVPSMIRKV